MMALMGHRGVILLTLVASLMWGLWWVPIRLFEGAGLSGVWASFALSAGALPVLGALAWRARGRLNGPQLAGAFLIGTAVMLYGSALTFTDVVRAVLLFYLAPAWSTAIECLFFGRRWGARSALALGLSFAGVATIFRFEIQLDGFNLGDMAALVSGMMWSAGAAIVFTQPDGKPAPLAFGACLGATLASALVLVIGGEAAGSAAAWQPGETALLSAGLGLLYVAPILFVTLWGAQRLAPATMSFLLTAEIVSGIGSSALFLDEPFGAPEAIGAVLVAAGALTETLAPPPRRAA